MRDKRMFQLSSGPRGKYVYHRSPSGRKVTRNVPNSVVTKNDAVRFLRESGGRGATRAQTPTKYVMIGGVRHPLGPKIPAQPLGCASLRNLSGVRRIGAGRQGVIYAATRRPHHLVREIAIKVAPFDKAAEKRGEKQPAQVEYDIQSAVRLASQGGIMSPMAFHECRDFVAVGDMNSINKGGKNIDPHRQFVLFMERADGGPLQEWIQAHASTLTNAKLFDIIGKVLVTLWKISKKYPEFRHNDLHLDNILMVKNVPKIADFGWARIQKTGTNPAVNTALKNGTAARYGIGPDTDPRYDAHLFLNELRRFLIKFGKFSVTVQFLNKYIPIGYREFTDTYTHEGRLKYSTTFPGLPTISKILEDKAMGGAGSPVRPKSVSPVRRPKSVSPRTNENFLAMTPRRFMKLTPKTRARAAAVRRAGAKGQQEKARAIANATRVPSPRRLEAPNKVRISPRTLRSNNFNKLVVRFLNKNNSAPYQNRWNAARAKAIKVVKNRLAGGKPAFSPKLPSPLSPLGPPKPRPKLPSPLSPLGPPKRRPSPAGVVRSAGSGRYKITGPSGRLVYADGSAVTMNFIKNLASRKGVSIKGLRSKDAIAKAIFNRN